MSAVYIEAPLHLRVLGGALVIIFVFFLRPKASARVRPKSLLLSGMRSTGNIQIGKSRVQNENFEHATKVCTLQFGEEKHVHPSSLKAVAIAASLGVWFGYCKRKSDAHVFSA